MKDSNANYEALMRSFLELTELKHILKKTQTFFEEVKFQIFVHTFYIVYIFSYAPVDLFILLGVRPVQKIFKSTCIWDGSTIEQILNDCKKCAVDAMLGQYVHWQYMHCVVCLVQCFYAE